MPSLSLRIFRGESVFRQRWEGRLVYWNIAGLRVAGIGGIIGNPNRVHRRYEDDYLETLKLLLDEHVDVMLMHEGPDGTMTDERGNTRIREVLEERSSCLVVRGHAHWQEPFAQFASG